MNTRRTQPYRAGGARLPSDALSAMRRGAPAFAPNPMNARRQAMKKGRRRRKAGKRAAGSLYALLVRRARQTSAR